MTPNEIQKLQELQKAIEFEQNNVNRLKDGLEASQKHLKELQDTFYELIDKDFLQLNN